MQKVALVQLVKGVSAAAVCSHVGVNVNPNCYAEIIDILGHFYYMFLRLSSMHTTGCNILIIWMFKMQFVLY